MTTQEVVDYILQDFNGVYKAIKNLAPQNSKYRSYDRGKLVNYIYVDGRRTYSNTNKLFNSVVNTIVQDGNTIISKIYVDKSKVPYYEKAVLQPTITYAKHFGRSEYGKIRYGQSRLITKKNRNYLYYMKGALEVSSVIGSWNGSVINVTDNIEDYMR